MIEDQTDLAQLLVLFLQEAGYEVIHVRSGEEGIERVAAGDIRLVILDINLPGIDGFTVCQRLRRSGDVPILMVSARIGKEDKLNGYLVGADDYMEKPVDPELLTAKVKAMLARTHASPDQTDRIVSGDIMIDVEARKVYKKGMPVDLSVKEYELLLLLMEHAGKVLHKDFLFNEIWGADSFSENQTLTVHIKKLRNKIEDDPGKPTKIRTIWGVGYAYEKI